MAARKIFLTKSRFRTGIDCATKLYYLDNKEYGNNDTGDSFLAALAEGGFQVGELAKIYHPGGTEVFTMDKDASVAETDALLGKENTVVYEAAFRFENLFVRSDIVVKNGNMIDLIEVKAKSFDPSEENPFIVPIGPRNKSPKVRSEWESYLQDVAFQAYVLKKAHPHLTVRCFLMLADKNAVATVNGINQRFFLDKADGAKTRVRVASGTSAATVGQPLLVKVAVDDAVELVSRSIFSDGLTFDKKVAFLSNICASGIRHVPSVSSDCKSCEFRIKADLKAEGLKSGFDECWSEDRGLKEKDLQKPFLFDIWNLRSSRKLIEGGKSLVEELVEADINPSSKAGELGLSTSERQWLQVEKIQKVDQGAYLDKEGLKREMSTWKYPLNFIDFETTMVAIPFHEGRRPYEQIAFQFSHHVVTVDGKIAHQNEYINREKGYFPNFDFVRALKKALETNDGTIFRYATHENTVLCQIRQQLLDSDEEIADRDELVAFIESITTATKSSGGEWVGPRTMVDMCEIVKKYFYHPLMGGSNSIKKVLPAVLQISEHLQAKYSKPIYGSKDIVSRNFQNWVWLQKDGDGKVADPYKLLPPVFEDLSPEAMESMITDGSLADGGAAMTSYARMQFTEMSELECERVATALLKYCELDTMAMVMIWEYWNNEVN